MDELDRLLELLAEERGEPLPAIAPDRKEDYFRALVNVRPPMEASSEFLELQDRFLARKRDERGVVRLDSLVFRDRVALWQGDITRLACDAIVNACNSALLGCFQPLHSCIDNAIHTNAGVQVRLDCHRMMQGRKEPNGTVRVTGAYNLPSRYIFHTVGPAVHGRVSQRDRSDLQSCYLSCLGQAEAMGLGSIAFCCISTGVFGFPQDEACSLAVSTVRTWLLGSKSALRVVFDVFSDGDRRLYEAALFH